MCRFHLPASNNRIHLDIRRLLGILSVLFVVVAANARGEDYAPLVLTLNGNWERFCADVNGDGTKEVLVLDCPHYGNLGIRVGRWEPNGELVCTWSSADMHQGGGAIQFLIGDINADRKSDIIQLWNNHGKLGAITYLSDGTGYSCAWGSDDLGQGSGAIGFWNADVNGDGKTDIIQLWSNKGRLGIITYLSDGAAYHCAWGSDDVGQSAGARDFVVCDVNGDGRSDFVQAYTTHGKIALITYLSNGNGYDCAWGSDNLGDYVDGFITGFISGDWNHDGLGDVAEDVVGWNGRSCQVTFLSTGAGFVRQ